MVYKNKVYKNIKAQDCKNLNTIKENNAKLKLHQNLEFLCVRLAVLFANIFCTIDQIVLLLSYCLIKQDINKDLNISFDFRGSYTLDA